MRRRAPLAVAVLLATLLGPLSAGEPTTPSETPAAPVSPDPSDRNSDPEIATLQQQVAEQMVRDVALQRFKDPALANALVEAMGDVPAHFRVEALGTVDKIIRMGVVPGKRGQLSEQTRQAITNEIAQWRDQQNRIAQRVRVERDPALVEGAVLRGLVAYERRLGRSNTGSTPVNPQAEPPAQGTPAQGTVPPLPGAEAGPLAGVGGAPGGVEGAEPPGGPNRVAQFMFADGVTGGDPWVLRNLGREQWRAADYHGTYDTMTRLLGKGVQDAEVRRVRGLAAQRLGDSERAHSDAAEALKRDPNDEVARSLLNLTKDQVSTVRLPDANALGQGPGDAGGHGPGPEARFASAGFVGAQAAAGARAPPKIDSGAILAAVQARSPGNPAQASRHLTEEAQRAWQLGDADAAILLASKALELNQRNPAAYHIRAVAHNRTGNFSMAVQDASASLALVPPARGVGVLSARAWAFNSMRRHDEALKDSLQARGIKPADGFALINEARALGGLGRRPEMLERLREAAAIEPGKYQPILDGALQLPDDADTELLFTRLPGAAQAPASPASSPSRTLRLILYVLAGGLLIAFGLHRLGFADKAATTARSLLNPTLSPAADEPAAAAPAEKTEPPASGFWSRYDEVKELAKGGMGVVYEAVDRGLGRRVAVKKMREELRTDSRERERFLQEARTVAGLRHPNIVQIYQVAEEGLDAYLVFEHVDGETLHDRLRARKRFALSETVEVLRGVCPAVEHAHAAGLMHRDLKPSNIMVDREGVVKVMDFGIARQAKDAMTKLSMTNTVCGTPPYMAPEQEQGLVCKESDIFSLGVLAYEMLSGVLPFEGQPAAMLLAKMSGRFEPLAERVKGLSPAVEAAVARALHQDPSKRWRRPSEFLAALEAAASAKA